MFPGDSIYHNRIKIITTVISSISNLIMNTIAQRIANPYNNISRRDYLNHNVSNTTFTPECNTLTNKDHNTNIDHLTNTIIQHQHLDKKDFNYYPTPTLAP